MKTPNDKKLNQSKRLDSKVGNDRPNIAIFAHSHPFYSRGGGEIVAYNSFRQFKSDGYNCSLFCAISPGMRPGTALFHPDEEIIEYEIDEYLLSVRNFDNFLHTHNSTKINLGLIETLRKRNIQIFHFHHFWNVGIDVIVNLKQIFRNAIFVMTVHEMLAICYRDGQMVKSVSNALCNKASALDCHLCFPDVDKDMFEMRANHMKKFLNLFDIIISPSEFLAERLADWGLVKDVYVIENGYTYHSPTPDIEIESRNLVSRFAFFGQPTAFKGLDIFIAAALEVIGKSNLGTQFAIYGCDKTRFLNQFGQHWNDQLESFSQYIQFHGLYRPEDVFANMRNNGWIVVPSIWWENSPLVIQEAFLAGRPPIVSNIGGMKEKVQDEVNGLHFQARSSKALAEVFLKASGNTALWSKLRSNRAIPPDMIETNKLIVELCLNQIGSRPV